MGDWNVLCQMPEKIGRVRSDTHQIRIHQSPPHHRFILSVFLLASLAYHLNQWIAIATGYEIISRRRTKQKKKKRLKSRCASFSSKTSFMCAVCVCVIVSFVWRVPFAYLAHIFFCHMQPKRSSQVGASSLFPALAVCCCCCFCA